MVNRDRERSLSQEETGSKALQLASLPSRWQSLVAAGMIIIAGLLAYHNSFGGPFIFDGRNSILENPHIRGLWPIWQVFRAEPGSTVAGRPILSLSFALNYQISGLKVWSYHAVNLTVHILAGLTLFGVIRRTLLCEELRARFGRSSFSLALACALIWLLHPLQTGSVTYIVQRAESLMGLFYLLVLYCAIRGFSSANSRRWYNAAILACALGMGTKEVVATAPLIVLLYDRIFFSSSFKQIFTRRRGLYLGLASTWIVLGALALTAPRGESVGFGFQNLTWFEYALTQCKVIVSHYLTLSFWPHPLVLDYGWPIARTFGEVGLYAAVLVVLLAATLMALRYRWGWGFLGAWFFLILAPSSSFVPIITEVAAEHRMYLPLAGIITLVVIWTYIFGKHLLSKQPFLDNYRKAIGYALLGIMLIALGMLTVRRNDDYHSELLIWQDTVFKRPENWRACYNGGNSYFNRGEWDKAIADYNQAIKLDSKYAEAHNNRGNTYFNKGDLNRAIADYNQAIRINPKFVLAYRNRGRAYKNKGELDRAVADYNQAIRLVPEYATSYNNRGNIYLSKGELDMAIVDYNQAIRLNPKYAMAHNNRGNAYFKKGELDRAIADYSQAIRLNPRFAPAYRNRGSAYKNKGEWDKARADYNQAIRLKPK